jgi:GNAT superfamily N-acetyltransferase
MSEGLGLDRDRLLQIEEAALNAWPAPRQMILDGWLLRFAGGYTKRANSVNPRYPSSMSLVEKIAACEQLYAAQGLPCLFRCPEPVSPPALIDALVQAGFAGFEPTLTLGRVLERDHFQLVDGIRLMDTVDWIGLRAQLTGTPIAQWAMHRTILDCIVPGKALVGLFVDQQPVACGMAVLEGDLLGFFSILTAPGERRKGYGSMIMGALSAWGTARGAAFGYLQVEGDNDPALAMYAQMGFKLCYPYVYYNMVVGE